MDLDLDAKRDACATLLDLVSGFDVGFTHFRTQAELEQVQYFLQIPVSQHPRRGDLAGVIDPLVAAGRDAWVMVEKAPHAYLKIPNDSEEAQLFFDPTMGLWTELCQADRLKGLAAKAPCVSPAHQAIPALIALVALDRSPDLELLQMLHGLVAYAWTPEFDSQDPAWQAAKASPALKAALKHSHQDWVAERFDARKALPYFEGAHGAFLAWWCEVYVS
jgi:hypothetical protein